MQIRRIALLLGVLVLAITGAAQAQTRAWVQIEAQPNLRAAEERARAYAGAFPDVAGFALASGWFGIVLGPYAIDAAPARLAELRAERLIPADSFVALGDNFRDQFWPVGADALARPLPAAPVDPAAEPAADPQMALAEPAPAPPTVAPADDETPAEARAAEAALDLPDREAVQTALQWFGFYAAPIDGAFGPGTRSAMADWQTAQSLDPTGILTTAQRGALVGDWRAALADIGLERVTEPEAGIAIDLPMAMVAFDHYEPPFVHYAEKNGSGVRVLLISQPGDQSTLFGLYDILQTLEIVPLAGERERGDRSFTISGRNGQIESYTQAELSGGLVKGFTLVWPVQDGARMARVLDAMKASFNPLGDRALDPGLAPMPEAARQGLLSGLEVRRPALSRSGFFIDDQGTVLTTADLLQSCTRLTIDAEQDMTLRLADPASGLAVLTPARPLAPAAFATFQTALERIGAEVVVAGYPFEDSLPAPTLTFGTLTATEGLEGEPGLKRLLLAARPGDAGGPVLDGTGAVIGMLLPRDTDAARQLPPDVAFAASAFAIAARLGTEGIALEAAGPGGALPPEDLTRRATGMTVLVSCWD